MNWLLAILQFFFARTRAEQVLAIVRRGLDQCLERLIDIDTGAFRTLSLDDLLDLDARSRNGVVALNHGLWLTARALLGLPEVIWQPDRRFGSPSRAPEPEQILRRLLLTYERLNRCDALAQRLARRLSRAESSLVRAPHHPDPDLTYAGSAQACPLRNTGPIRTFSPVGAVLAALPRPG